MGRNSRQKTIQKMTLQSYDAGGLDQIALRLLDVSCRLRQMAQRARDESLTDVQLNDKKALQWLDELENWSQKAAADVEHAAIRQRGSRRATKRPPVSVLSWKSVEIVLRPGRGPCRLSRKEKADGHGTTESGVDFERRGAANVGALGAAAQEQPAAGAEVANRFGL